MKSKQLTASIFFKEWMEVMRFFFVLFATIALVFGSLTGCIGLAIIGYPWIGIPAFFLNLTAVITFITLKMDTE